MMSLLYNTLPGFVIAFLPRSKCLLISWLQSPSAVILEPKKRKCHCSHFFPFYLPWSDKTIYIQNLTLYRSGIADEWEKTDHSIKSAGEIVNRKPTKNVILLYSMRKSLSCAWLSVTPWTVSSILACILHKWAFPFSRGSSQPTDWIQVAHIIGGFFTSWTTRDAQEYWSG